jgi:hypothetical protein
MADDEILNIEQHRQAKEDDSSSVRCFRCGKSIPAVSTRCPHCRVHFQGVAEDFDGEEDEYRRKRQPWWVIITAIILLLFLIAGVFEFGFWWLW